MRLARFTEKPSAAVEFEVPGDQADAVRTTVRNSPRARNPRNRAPDRLRAGRGRSGCNTSTGSGGSSSSIIGRDANTMPQLNI